MTGLDHKRADLSARENFAVSRENMQKVLTDAKVECLVSGCVIISTCNRTELYATLPDNVLFEPSMFLCDAQGVDFAQYAHLFTERFDDEVFEHLSRVASGLDSQIMGEDQIITQVREGVELSRSLGCTDGYLETMFRLCIQAAKSIRTNVIQKSLTVGSAPSDAVDRLKTLCNLNGKNAVVIGNGQMGRLVGKLLIAENVNVTVTLREYKKGVIKVPDGANTINYSERYKAIEAADIVVSATTSPHFTLDRAEFDKLSRLPEYIVDLAVPRDVDPAIAKKLTLLTIDDISGENAKNRTLPPESILLAESIIDEHFQKYSVWSNYRRKGVMV